MEQDGHTVRHKNLKCSLKGSGREVGVLEFKKLPSCFGTGRNNEQLLANPQGHERSIPFGHLLQGLVWAGSKQVHTSDHWPSPWSRRQIPPSPEQIN
jgi:hypothetical protein